MQEHYELIINDKGFDERFIEELEKNYCTYFTEEQNIGADGSIIFQLIIALSPAVMTGLFAILSDWISYKLEHKKSNEDDGEIAITIKSPAGAEYIVLRNSDISSLKGNDINAISLKIQKTINEFISMKK
ncbi:MAG: hypothetical protein E7570_01925 [Ruminococcaceae bacterium]|nr:hypothetical protein [Oscillospiraceae bacterium]